jgi:hypothetical protein
MAMKRSRLEQPGLFDVPVLPVGLSALQQTKALTLLGTLLAEALTGETAVSAVIQSQEADDDEDHG